MHTLRFRKECDDPPFQRLVLPAHLLLLLLCFRHGPLPPSPLTILALSLSTIVVSILRLVCLARYAQPLMPRQPRERNIVRAVHSSGELRRGRERSNEVGIQRDRVGLNLVEEVFDFALAASARVLEGIGFGAVEVRLARTRYEDTGHSSGVAYREGILEGAETEGSDGTVRNGVCEV